MKDSFLGERLFHIKQPRFLYNRGNGAVGIVFLTS